MMALGVEEMRESCNKGFFFLFLFFLQIFSLSFFLFLRGSTGELAVDAEPVFRVRQSAKILPNP
jgi:hypothetical protein